MGGADLTLKPATVQRCANWRLQAFSITAPCPLGFAPMSDRLGRSFVLRDGDALICSAVLR
jgi:hypothetical protein